MSPATHPIDTRVADVLAAARASVEEHLARRHGLPRDVYISPELFDAELAGIVRNSWVYVGHESQLDSPGRYLTVSAGDDSVIVARTAEGSLAGSHNVCRHRGARLLTEPCGSERLLVCPYHQWSYHLDGSLKAAPRMPSDFDPTVHGLVPVSVESWNGLVFVNLATDPEPLARLFADADEVFAPYELADARVAHTEVYTVEANWKIVWENSQECYHCNVNHPEFVRSFDVGELHDTEWQECEIHPSADRRTQFARFPLRGDAVSLTLDGVAASSKPFGAFARGLAPITAAIHLKPTFAMVCCPDYAVVIAERPTSVSTTDVTATWLVRGDAVDGVDFDVENLAKVWHATNLQDWDLCARTQLGVRSPAYVAGPLAADERSVADFHRAYSAMLADAERTVR